MGFWKSSLYVQCLFKNEYRQARIAVNGFRDAAVCEVVQKTVLARQGDNELHIVLIQKAFYALHHITVIAVMQLMLEVFQIPML